MTFYTTAFVLCLQNRGESDRWAHLYTDHYGKLEVLVRSSRELRSKLSPHLEELTLAACFIARGRVDHLIGLERLDRFSILHQSLDHLVEAAWAASIVDELTKPEHPDQRIFKLLAAWFSFLEGLDEVHHLERFHLFFLLCLLDYLGYRPDFQKCLICKNLPAHPPYFSAVNGGLLCAGCVSQEDHHLVLLKDEEWSRLSDFEFSPRFEISAGQALGPATARQLTEALLSAHLTRPRDH